MLYYVDRVVNVNFGFVNYGVFAGYLNCLNWEVGFAGTEENPPFLQSRQTSPRFRFCSYGKTLSFYNSDNPYL